MVPADGYIKKFVVVETGLKFYYNERDVLDGDSVTSIEKIIEIVGLDIPIPLFTLVKIERHKKQTTLRFFEVMSELKYVDVGTYYFMFSKFYDDDAGSHSYKIEFVFKSAQPNQPIFVRAKDILNIRSEFTTNFDDITPLKKKGVDLIFYPYSLEDIKEGNYYTYLATILIELDPL